MVFEYVAEDLSKFIKKNKAIKESLAKVRTNLSLAHYKTNLVRCSIFAFKTNFASRSKASQYSYFLRSSS